jgi:hypothetical protein
MGSFHILMAVMSTDSSVSTCRRVADESPGAARQQDKQSVNFMTNRGTEPGAARRGGGTFRFDLTCPRGTIPGFAGHLLRLGWPPVHAERPLEDRTRTDVVIGAEQLRRFLGGALVSE